METRIKSLWVGPKGGELFDERAFTVELENAAAGEFVLLRANHTEESRNQVSIDPEEWPAVRAAVDYMALRCRPNTLFAKDALRWEEDGSSWTAETASGVFRMEWADNCWVFTETPWGELPKEGWTAADNAREWAAEEWKRRGGGMKTLVLIGPTREFQPLFAAELEEAHAFLSAGEIVKAGAAIGAAREDAEKRLKALDAAADALAGLDQVVVFSEERDKLRAYLAGLKAFFEEELKDDLVFESAMSAGGFKERRMSYAAGDCVPWREAQRSGFLRFSLEVRKQETEILRKRVASMEKAGIPSEDFRHARELLAIYEEAMLDCAPREKPTLEEIKKVLRDAQAKDHQEIPNQFFFTLRLWGGEEVCLGGSIEGAGRRFLPMVPTTILAEWVLDAAGREKHTPEEGKAVRKAICEREEAEWRKWTEERGLRGR